MMTVVWTMAGVALAVAVLVVIGSCYLAAEGDEQQEAYLAAQKEDGQLS